MDSPPISRSETKRQRKMTWWQAFRQAGIPLFPFSSRSRGTWKRRPALALRAANCWYGREEIGEMDDAEELEEVSVSDKARRKAWARLLAKVYEIDVFTS